MECPGLPGLWRACPPFVEGLTGDEVAFFVTIAIPIALLALAVVAIGVALLSALVTGGLPLGQDLRSRPRESDLPAIRRHVLAGRHDHHAAAAAVARDAYVQTKRWSADLRGDPLVARPTVVRVMAGRATALPDPAIRSGASHHRRHAA